MDELPRHAKAIAKDARNACGPPPGAKQRVRARLALLMAAAAGSAGAERTAHATRSRAGGAASLALSIGALVAASGAGFCLEEKEIERASVSLQTSPPAPAVVDTPVATPPPRVEEVRAPTEAPAPPAGRRQRKPAAEGGDTDLLGELRLLSAASDALFQRDLGLARELLEAHRARYPQGQLRAERSGLQVIQLCLAGTPGAELRARTYLESAPASLVSSRLALACHLEPERQPETTQSH